MDNITKLSPRIKSFWFILFGVRRKCSNPYCQVIFYCSGNCPEGRWKGGRSCIETDGRNCFCRNCVRNSFWVKSEKEQRFRDCFPSNKEVNELEI